MRCCRFFEMIQSMLMVPLFGAEISQAANAGAHRHSNDFRSIDDSII